MYECEFCKFSSSKLWMWNRHLATEKHKINTQAENAIFVCSCNKQYAHRQSLYAHKRKCSAPQTTVAVVEEKPQSTDHQLVMTLLQQNTELQNRIIEMSKEREKPCHNTFIYNEINNHFNINVFLNEHCKDAINIKDFIHSVQLQLDDLEHVGNKGFVDGISDIIITKLRDLDIYKRPLHCSDAKREIMYVRDDNKWLKEGPTKSKIKHAIKCVAYKNSQLLPQYVEKYPNCYMTKTENRDRYGKLLFEALGGSGNNTAKKENKIIKKIIKEVSLNKRELTKIAKTNTTFGKI